MDLGLRGREAVDDAKHQAIAHRSRICYCVASVRTGQYLLLIAVTNTLPQLPCDCGRLRAR